MMTEFMVASFIFRTGLDLDGCKGGQLPPGIVGLSPINHPTPIRLFWVILPTEASRIYYNIKQSEEISHYCFNETSYK